MAAEFDQAHRPLQAQAADSLANALFGDEGFGRVGNVGDGIEMGRRRLDLARHGYFKRGKADLVRSYQNVTQITSSFDGVNSGARRP